MPNYAFSPSGEFPVLTVNGGAGISGLYDIFRTLHKMGYQLKRDIELASNVSATTEILALSSLIEDRLYKCQLFDLWGEVVNYEAFTKFAYSQKYSFPLNWWIPRQRKQSVLTYLSTDGLDDVEKVKRVAEEIYSALSRRLGDEDFFFWRPTNPF